MVGDAEARQRITQARDVGYQGIYRTRQTAGLYLGRKIFLQHDLSLVQRRRGTSQEKRQGRRDYSPAQYC